jgi:putative ABC transport system permease protein
MLGLAARNFTARKFRALSTALAVFFGVAMVAGTLLLTDSVNRSFDELFTEVNEEIDVTVRSRVAVEAEFGTAPQTGFDASLLKTVSRVPGVATAEGVIGDDTITILGDDGERIGPPQGGPPHIAASTVGTPEFEALTVVEGEEPASGDEFALDEASAEEAGFEVGDQVRVTGQAGARTYTLVGITEFGSGASLGGASLALFTLPEAQRLTDKQGRFDEIDIVAEDGVTPEQLATAVASAVGRDFDVRTGSETASEDSGDIKEGFGFLSTALLVFAGIAVFVGGFLIFNTFSITVAQRVREFAVLRTLGASARQVLSAVLVEAALIGLLASALGIAGGFGFVELIKGLFNAMGFDLPVTSLRLEPGTVGIAVAVGLGATVASALVPALRATRVAPLEALRESGGSLEAAERKGRRRAIVAALLIALGAALIALGLFASGEIGSALAQLGLGLVLLFIGVAMLGGRFVPPLASAIGWPIERLRGVTGRLARENSQRQPGRTATTAAALMIGVALVVFVGVFSSSLKASINETLDRQFAGDLTILNKDGFSPISPRIADEVAAVDGVEVVSPVASIPALVEGIGEEITLAGLEPEGLDRIANLDWVEGSNATLDELGETGALVEEGWGEDSGVVVGDEVDVIGPNAETVAATVEGSVRDSAGLFVQTLALPRATVRERLGARDDFMTLIGFAPGAEREATRTRVDELLEQRFPNAEARDQEELKEDQSAQVDQLVTLIYVLLGLSVIVSVFGIVNTLALTILERTRELGMLRAIGTSRSQVRRMVRYESVINALLGTVVGTVIGLVLAAAAVTALEDEGLVLSIPAALPIVVLLAAIFLGVLAAIGPARRTSRLDVIEALQYE